jgi:hypothetical protein
MTKTNYAKEIYPNWSFVLLIVFCIAVYLPLISHGGIIVDDWGDIAHNLDCNGFLHCYQTWFPLFSNRPLAPLPITVSTFLFGTFFQGYLILNTAVYLAAIFITRKVISELIGNGPSIVFALFAVIPFIAMPVIASPINQLTATVSFLLWALSFRELNHFIKYSNNKSYVLVYVFLLLAFLTYEVILPLLVFTALLPYISNGDNLRNRWLIYLLRFILPIALVLAVTVLWQKGIAPQFMEVDSRLKLNPQQMLAKLHTWGHVFYAQIPSLFLKTPAFIQPLHFILIGIFALAAWLGLSKPMMSNKNDGIYRFLLVSILCFLSTSSIFILSNESANSWGYQARGLSSTWFALSILLGSLSSINGLKKVIILPSIVIFGIMSTLSFVIQRDNYVQSWKVQMAIVSNILGLINKNQIADNAIIIGDVPKFVTPNFNDEIIFSQPWDFGGALALFSDGKVKEGAVIDSKRQDFNRLLISNDVIMINDWWKTNADKLWLYEFDPVSQQGIISKVKNVDSFREKMNSLGYKPAP